MVFPGSAAVGVPSPLWPPVVAGCHLLMVLMRREFRMPDIVYVGRGSYESDPHVAGYPETVVVPENVRFTVWTDEGRGFELATDHVWGQLQSVDLGPDRVVKNMALHYAEHLESDLLASHPDLRDFYMLRPGVEFSNLLFLCDDYEGTCPKTLVEGDPVSQKHTCNGILAQVGGETVHWVACAGFGFGLVGLPRELREEIGQHLQTGDRESVGRANHQLRGEFHDPDYRGGVKVLRQQELDQALDNPALSAIYLHGRNLRVDRVPVAAGCRIVANADMEVGAAATVYVDGHVTVVARGGAVIHASGDAHVIARDCYVTAEGKARIDALGDSEVRASGSTMVHATDSAKVWADGKAWVAARDRATVTSLAGTVRIWVCGPNELALDNIRGTRCLTPSHLMPRIGDFNWGELQTQWRIGPQH